MFIVNQSTARKRAGEESFVKRLVIVSLRSITVAVSLKKRDSNEIKITSLLLALISLKIKDTD